MQVEQEPVGKRAAEIIIVISVGTICMRGARDMSEGRGTCQRGDGHVQGAPRTRETSDEGTREWHIQGQRGKQGVQRTCTRDSCVGRARGTYEGADDEGHKQEGQVRGTSTR